MILGYMQSIKQFGDNPMSMGCMICLYTCLYIRFEALTDGRPSMGCTCPKALFRSKKVLDFDIVVLSFYLTNIVQS